MAKYFCLHNKRQLPDYRIFNRRLLDDHPVFKYRSPESFEPELLIYYKDTVHVVHKTHKGFQIKK